MGEVLQFRGTIPTGIKKRKEEESKNKEAVDNIMEFSGAPLDLELNEGGDHLKDFNKIIYAAFTLRFKEKIFSDIGNIWYNREEKYIFFQYSCNDEKMNNSMRDRSWYPTKKHNTQQLIKFQLEIYEIREITQLFWKNSGLSKPGKNTKEPPLDRPINKVISLPTVNGREK